MAKEVKNKGWIKELKANKGIRQEKQSFSYSNPVTTPQKPNSLGFNTRAKKHKAVDPSKEANFCQQQSKALENKGKS